MAHATFATPRALAYAQNQPVKPAAKPAGKPCAPAAVAPPRGFFTRFFDAIAEARMRQAEREIARYFAGGVKFTDEAEREIERRFLSYPPR